MDAVEQIFILAGALIVAISILLEVGKSHA